MSKASAFGSHPLGMRSSGGAGAAPSRAEQASQMDPAACTMFSEADKVMQTFLLLYRPPGTRTQFLDDACALTVESINTNCVWRHLKNVQALIMKSAVKQLECFARLLVEQLTLQTLGCPQRAPAAGWAVEPAGATGWGASPPAWHR